MDAKDIIIRPARAEAAGAIAAMANALNVFEGKPGDVYSEELVEAQAFGAAPLFSVLVAEVDGAVLLLGRRCRRHVLPSNPRSGSLP